MNSVGSLQRTTSTQKNRAVSDVSVSSISGILNVVTHAQPPSKKKQIEKQAKPLIKPSKTKQSLIVSQRTSIKIGQRINQNGVVEPFSSTSQQQQHHHHQQQQFQQQQQQQQQLQHHFYQTINSSADYPAVPVAAVTTTTTNPTSLVYDPDQSGIGPIYSNKAAALNYQLSNPVTQNIQRNIYDSKDYFKSRVQMTPPTAQTASSTFSGNNSTTISSYHSQLIQPNLVKKQSSQSSSSSSQQMQQQQQKQQQSYDHQLGLPLVRRSSSSGGSGTGISSNTSYFNNKTLTEGQKGQVHRLEQPSTLMMPISLRSQQSLKTQQQQQQAVSSSSLEYPETNGLNFTFREQSQQESKQKTNAKTKRKKNECEIEIDDDILPFEFPANQWTNPNDQTTPQVQDRFGHICSFLDKSLSKHSSIASSNSNNNSQQQLSEQSFVARLPAPRIGSKANFLHSNQITPVKSQLLSSHALSNNTSFPCAQNKFSLIDQFVLKKHGHFSDEYECATVAAAAAGSDSHGGQQQQQSSSANTSEKDGKKLIMLGRGGFGQVYLIKQKQGAQEERAMKIIPKSFHEAFREVMMLKRFSHPNVLKIYEYFEDDSNLYVITERCYGYNLFDYIILKGQFTEFETCKIADGVLRALSEAHKQSIVHRDVKPDNIMLDFNVTRETFNVKLIDWGLADSLAVSNNSGESKFLSKRCGTLHYLAPEVLSKRYNEKVDLWSLGMVLFTLIQGSPPICGKSQANILEQVQAFECSFKYSCWNAISDEAKELISMLLERDPAKRISAVDALRHPWFSQLAGSVVINTQDLRCSYANLVKYSQSNTFKKTMLGFFASHLISKRERERFLAMFSVLDADKDGELCVQELKSGFARLFSEEEFSLCQSEIESIFYSSLSSKFEGANGIKYEEFLSSMLACSATYSQEALKQAFGLFDRENSGRIHYEEILKTLEIPNDSEAALSFQASLYSIDQNHNGLIDFDDFSRIMKDFLDQNSQVILSQDIYLQ